MTHSRKLEGQWWGDDGVYFVASFARLADGSVKEHDGQVWFYDPREKSVTLKTIFGVNRTPDVEGPFDGPDNITVSPHGGLILAEDGNGIKYLIGVSEAGTAYALARNDHRTAAGARTNGEFAGATFSRDGRTLFVNIYTGWVFAITGPWRRRRRDSGSHRVGVRTDQPAPAGSELGHSPDHPPVTWSMIQAYSKAFSRQALYRPLTPPCPATISVLSRIGRSSPLVATRRSAATHLAAST